MGNCYRKSHNNTLQPQGAKTCSNITYGHGIGFWSLQAYGPATLMPAFWQQMILVLDIGKIQACTVLMQGFTPWCRQAMYENEQQHLPLQ